MDLTHTQQSPHGDSSDQEEEHRPIQYFMPGQILLLISHTEPVSTEQLGDLVKALNETLKCYEIPSQIAPPRRVLTFPDNVEPEFSLAFSDVSGEAESPEGLLRLIDVLNGLCSQPLTFMNGLTVQVASPDWLVSGAYHGIGTGGPGTEPIPAEAPAPGAWKFGLPGGLRVLEPLVSSQASWGRGINVAILDTAPCVHDLIEAYHTRQPPHSKGEHPLVNSLLHPDGPLRVHPAEYTDLHRLASFSLKDHAYKMTDHGLFVAGIIHSIAPQATLHLFEVLNPYGVGDIESVTLGLWEVLQLFKERPRVVVNCSLCMNLPLPGHPRDDLPQANSLPLNTDTDESRHLLERMGWPLKWVCDLLAGRGIQVVAAAGNDGKDGHRPNPRYPAAFESVIGVGALEKNEESGGLRPAPYSNKSDIPVRRGLAAFGGGKGKGNGVLGIYLGKFPDGSRNDTDWAWWAGTSFATPVVSGLIAALLSLGLPSSLALMFLQVADPTAPTPVGEETLDITQ